VGLGVVGQHPLDPHPLVGEEPSRLDQEASAGRGGLVVQELAEGDPRAVIDRRMDIVIADAPAPGCLGPAVDAVAATIRDAAELLYFQVDQLPGPRPLVAA